MPTLSIRVAASTDDAWQSGAGVPNLTSTTLRWGDDSTNVITGARFLNVTVPQGTTITSATLTLTASETYSNGAISTTVVGEAADNAATFAATSNNLGSAVRARTTARTSAWTLSTVSLNNTYDKDVTAVVQEIVNRTGWSSGNALALFCEDNASPPSEWQEFRSYNGSTTQAPLLTIVYPDSGAASAPLAAPRIPRSILAR